MSRARTVRLRPEPRARLRARVSSSPIDIIAWPSPNPLGLASVAALPVFWGSTEGYEDWSNRRELRWRTRGVVAEQEDQIVVAEQLTAGRYAIDDQSPGFEELTDILGRLADRCDCEGHHFVRRIRNERHDV